MPMRRRTLYERWNDVVCLRVSHSVSLGTDLPVNQNSAIFLSSKVLKNVKKWPKQAENPDNSSMSYIFNNNTFTDFRAAYKHVLITNYLIQVIQKNQSVTKLNINWLFG